MPFINFNTLPHLKLRDGIHGGLYHSDQLTFGHLVLEEGAVIDSFVKIKPAGGSGDVRIGRYLNQSIITREDKVQNIANSESAGIGIRVIANGAWGFAATRSMWLCWGSTKRSRKFRWA